MFARSPKLLAATAAALLCSVLPIGTGGAGAVQVPPASSAFYIQTNGPSADIGLGDWYTSKATGGGKGAHFLSFTIPCSWPAGVPINVDLFSPEMNRVAGANGTTEEPNGTYDSTTFELFGPGAVANGDGTSPASNTGISGTRRSFSPSSSPEAWMRYWTFTNATCGQYLIRSAVGTDDQNGWKLRVGYDNDANPNNAPPANTDNYDGVPGTDDEIVIGLAVTSYQHDAGGTACQTFYQFVRPSQAAINLNNFDFDGNGTIRYYPPSATFDPLGATGGIAGSVSTPTATWNAGSGTPGVARIGDRIANPEPGWWRLVACVSNHNQVIVEGQTGVPAYLSQPPTPVMSLTKTDGTTTAYRNGNVTYRVTASNTASGTSAGAARNVVIADTLPTGTTYVSCQVVAPATGTCAANAAGDIVTGTITGKVAAGTAAAIDVTVDIPTSYAATTVTNQAKVDFTDSLGNPFPTVTASDVDTIVNRAPIVNTHTVQVPPSGVVNFTIELYDPDGDPFVGRGITPSAGCVHSLSYDPVTHLYTLEFVAEGFVGTTTLVLEVADANGATTQATVTFVVPPPTAAAVLANASLHVPTAPTGALAPKPRRAIAKVKHLPREWTTPRRGFVHWSKH